MPNADGSETDVEKLAREALEAEAEKNKKVTKKDPLEEWDAYLESLDPEVRKEVEAHTTGLTSALQKERQLNKLSKPGAAARLAELEKAEEERQNAGKTALEKAQGEATTAKQQTEQAKADLKKERTRNALILAATKAGFNDPEDALREEVLAELETSTPEELRADAEKQIAALVKAKPYLVGKEPTRQIDIDGSTKGGAHGARIAAKDEIMKKKREKGAYSL